MEGEAKKSLEFQVKIENSEQLVDIYPDLFKKVVIGNTSFYIQDSKFNRQPDERYILTTKGVIRLFGEGLLDIQTEKLMSKDLLMDINKFANDQEWKYINEKEVNTEIGRVNIEGKESTMVFLPYADDMSAEFITDTLSDIADTIQKGKNDNADVNKGLNS